MALFYRAPEGDTATIFGANVAIGEFTRSLLALTREPRFMLACHPRAVEALGPAATKLTQAQVEAVGYDDLPLRAARGDIGLWHDLAADVTRPFYLRNRFATHPYPVTITHHTISYQSWLYHWYLRLLLTPTYPHDAMVCTSVAARDALRAGLDLMSERFERAHGVRLTYRGQFEVIPLGVDTDVFAPRDPLDCRRQLKLPEDRPVVLWLGRLSFADKADMLPLLGVMQRLVRRKRPKRPYLVIAGSERAGDTIVLEEYIRALGLEGDCRIVRHVDPQFRHLVHSAADLFVSPVDNVQETFGLTPIEAMAAGVPQVVSDWNGYRDTVVHDVTGKLVKTHWRACSTRVNELSPLYEEVTHDHFRTAQTVAVDPEALFAALSELLDDEPLRRTLAKRSRQRALEHYAWPKVVARYEALWRRLRDESRGAERLPLTPSFDQPDYFRMFQGYASSLVGDDAKLRLTRAGLAVKLGHAGLPLYDPATGIDEATLASLFEQASSRRAQPFKAHVARHPAERHEVIERHLMWLLKYGYLAVAG